MVVIAAAIATVMMVMMMLITERKMLDRVKTIVLPTVTARGSPRSRTRVVMMTSGKAEMMHMTTTIPMVHEGQWLT